MIKKEREYRITKAQGAQGAAWIEEVRSKLERALTELSSASSEQQLHPLLQKAQREAIQSQLEELQELLADCELLQAGNTAVTKGEDHGR